MIVLPQSNETEKEKAFILIIDDDPLVLGTLNEAPLKETPLEEAKRLNQRLERLFSVFEDEKPDKTDGLKLEKKGDD